MAEPETVDMATADGDSADEPESASTRGSMASAAESVMPRPEPERTRAAANPVAHGHYNDHHRDSDMVCVLGF